MMQDTNMGIPVKKIFQGENWEWVLFGSNLLLKIRRNPHDLSDWHPNFQKFHIQSVSSNSQAFSQTIHSTKLAHKCEMYPYF